MLNEAPFITTIIPTYRRPALLKRAIISVLSQTYANVRVCVYDNASGDETERIVRGIMAHDSRVRYVGHEENLGAIGNFNFGLKNIETPFFSFLSDDDLLLPLFYEKAMQAFKQHSDAGFVCSGAIAVDDRNNVLSGSGMVREISFFTPETGFEGIVTGAIPGTWTGIVFRKEVRDAIGLVNIDGGPTTDGSYVWHAAARFPFVVLPEVGAILLSQKASTSGSYNAVSKDWALWRTQMIEDITSDTHIPPHIYKNLEKLVPKDFGRIAFYQVGKALMEGRVDIAKKAVGGLSDLGYAVESKILQGMIWLYTSTSFFKALVRLIQRWRGRRKETTNHELNKKYQKEITSLVQLNTAVDSWEGKRIIERDNSG